VVFSRGLDRFASALRFNAQPPVKTSWICGANVGVAVSSKVAIQPVGLKKVTPQMTQGIVKWFNDSKGFGFISLRRPVKTCSSTTRTSSAKATRSLQEGAKVQFEIVAGQKGPRAAKVEQLA